MKLILLQKKQYLKSTFRYLSSIGVFLFLLTSSFALAEEEILSFVSHIAVLEDSSISVREEITVKAEGIRIKRGIFRDFPSIRKTSFGLVRGSGFRVVSVEKDGYPEKFTTQKIQGGFSGDGGIRIRIGSKNTFLSPGIYTYAITYITTNQIDFDSDKDSLLWNVTGNGWDFTIKKAEAYISLPVEIYKNDVVLTGFTGGIGSKEQSIIVSKESIRTPYNYYISSERTLYSREGLTMSIGFPKGFVNEPTFSKKVTLWMKYNVASIFAFIGFFFVLLYYYLIWREVGVDPEKGTIIPIYESPEGLSPASLRYLLKMNFDKKAFTAEILEMAIRGYLKIENSDSVYTLKKTGRDDALLSQRQKSIANKLFDTSSKLVLKNENHHKFSRAINFLHEDLKSEHLKRHFFLNRKYFIWGLVLSFTVLMVSSFLHSPEAAISTGFMSFWLAMWTFGVIALSQQLYSEVLGAKRKKTIMSFGTVLFQTIMFMPFLVGEGFGLYFLFSQTSIIIGIVTLSLGLLGFLFFHLLKAPTLRGRRIMDRIEGLKLYLGVAEKERLHFAHPPEKTAKIFEKFLPYALALDVEQEWAENFSEIIESSSELKDQKAYKPSFYRGNNFSNVSNLSSSIGSSFSSALSSASTAPRSSGGSGGGGFSGGGGGGGGGGGW